MRLSQSIRSTHDILCAQRYLSFFLQHTFHKLLQTISYILQSLHKYYIWKYFTWWVRCRQPGLVKTNTNNTLNSDLWYQAAIHFYEAGFTSVTLNMPLNKGIRVSCQEWSSLSDKYTELIVLLVILCKCQVYSLGMSVSTEIWHKENLKYTYVSITALNY